MPEADPYDALLAAKPNAPPPSDDPYDALMTGAPAPDPTKGISGYTAAGGRATWSDVGEGFVAGVHGALATGAGAAASVSDDPEITRREQEFATRQQQAEREAESQLTPYSQQPGFFSHPLVSTAEALPETAAVVVPTALSGPAAPAVGAILMGLQQRGATYNEMMQAAIEKGMTPQEADAAIRNSGALTAATAIGAATGLFPEVAGPLVSKIAVPKLVGMALKGGIEGGGFAGGAAAAEYGTQRGEQGMGTRTDLDVNQIVEAGRSGFEQGLAFGVLPHSGAHRNPVQTGGKATVPRTPTEQRATESKPKVTAQPTKDADTQKTGPAPPAPKLDPDQAAAAAGKPITPEGKAAPPPAEPDATGWSVTPAGKPPEEPVKQPPVEQPPPTQLPAEPALEPQKPPAEPPPPTEQAGPQPPPEPQPAPAPAPPDRGPMTRDPRELEAEHGELIDQTHGRDAVIYPPGVSPTEIIQDKWRYGSVKLPDGRTIQYDWRGENGWSKDKIKAAAKDGTLESKIQQAADKSVAGEPAAGGPGKGAGPAAAAPSKYDEIMAEIAARKAAMDAAERGEYTPPVDVQPKDVQPEVADPLAGMKKLAETKWIELHQDPEGKYFVKKLSDGSVREVPHGTAEAMFPGVVKGAAEQVMAGEPRLTPELEAAREEQRKRRVLQAQGEEEEKAQKAQREAQAKAAEQGAAKPVTRQTKEPELQKPGKDTKRREANIENNRKADEAMAAGGAAHLPSAAEEKFANRDRGGGGKEARQAIKERVDRMMAAAKTAGFEFSDKLRSRKDPLADHNTASTVLHFAKALADKKEPKYEDFLKFKEKEDKALSGEAGRQEALAQRRAEGKEFAAAKGEGVKEKAAESIEDVKGIEHVETADEAHERELEKALEAKRTWEERLKEKEAQEREAEAKEAKRQEELRQEAELQKRALPSEPEIISPARARVMDEAGERAGATETSPGVWRATVDGRTFGDSRGYRSRSEAVTEAEHMVRQDEIAKRVREEQKAKVTPEGKEGEGYRVVKAAVGFKVEAKPKRKIVKPEGKFLDVPTVEDMLSGMGWTDEEIKALESATGTTDTVPEDLREAVVPNRSKDPDKINLVTRGKLSSIKVRRSETARDMLSGIKDDIKSGGPGDAIASAMLDRISSSIGDVMVRYVSKAEITKHAVASGKDPIKFRPGGMYDFKTHQILINDQNLTHEFMVRAKFHEAMHAATSLALERMPGFKKLIDDISDAAYWKEAADELGGTKYAFTDAHEFIAEIFANKKLRDYLATRNVPKEIKDQLDIDTWRKQTGFKRAIKTLWDATAAAIGKVLKLPPRGVSYLEATLSAVEQAMDVHDADVRSGMEIKFLAEDPEEGGRTLKGNMKAWTDKLKDAYDDMATDKNEGMKTFGERVLSEPQMYDTHRDLFKEGRADPMRDRLDAMQRRGGRAEELSEPGKRLAREWTKLADKHGVDGMAKLSDVMRMANEFEVYPHDALGEGMNAHLKGDTLANKQARAVFPELAKKWDALHQDLQDHFLAHDAHFKADLNSIREVNAKNLIEGIDPPAGSSTQDVLKRMLDGKLTDADKDYYKRLGVEGMDADVFQRKRGPYLPAGRHGDFVVRAEHDVLTPKGSDRDFFGKELGPNLRRFDTEAELDDFLGKVNLPAKPHLKYYFENPAGGRIYEVPDAEGNLRPVAHNEAGIGYGPVKHEYWANVQYKRNEFAKTLSAGQDIHARLKEAGLKNVTGVEHRRGQGVDASMTSAQTQAALAAIRKRRDLTELQKQALTDAIRETAIVTQSGSRITKNFVHSQKVQGAEYGGEALMNHALSSARYRASAEFQPKIDGAFEAMRQVMRDNPDDKNTTARSRVYNELSRRSYNATPENMYPTYSPIVQKGLQMAFATDMMSASHLLTHQVNLHYMASAVLAPRHGLIPTFRKFYQIMREAGGPWMAIKRGFGQAYTQFRDPEADYTSMFNMMRNSITDARRLSVVDDLAATQHIHKDSGIDAIDFARERGALDKVSRFIRNASGAMDSMGRFVTGLSAYDLEYAKNGGDHEAALLHARQTIEKGLVHYGPGMRAPVFSGKLMRVMSQFRQPGANMLYLLGRNAYLAFRSANKEAQHEAWWALGSMLVGGWALSGTAALPTEPLKMLEILGSQLGITPTPSEASARFRMWMANSFGPNVANAFMDGPLALLPVAPSFAHRVASPELTFGEPASNKPEDFMSWLASFTFGATGSMGVNYLHGSQALLQGNFEDAIKYMAPKQIADMARAMQVYEGREDQKGPLTPKPQGLTAAILQGFGVRTQQTVRAQEGRRAYFEEQQAERTSKSAAMKGGPAAVLKWNAANPHNKITQAEIRQSKKQLTAPLKGPALEYQHAYQ